jgi:hypothetical protein
MSAKSPYVQHVGNEVFSSAFGFRRMICGTSKMFSTDVLRADLKY